MNMGWSLAAILCAVIPSILSGVAIQNHSISQPEIDKMQRLTMLSSQSQVVPPKTTGIPDWEIAAGGKMRFDVASIKRDKPDLLYPRVITNIPLGPQNEFRPTGGLFSAKNIQLFLLLQFAYKLNVFQARAVRSQLPAWAVTNYYDIEARAQGNPTKDQFRLMTQALLADRFKLAVHFETSQVPVFAIVLRKPGKLGPSLRPHLDEPPCRSVSEASSSDLPIATITGGYPLPCHIVLDVPPRTPGFRAGEGARDVTIESIATALTIPALTRLDRPLIDKSGLTGNYDFVLEWSGAQSINRSPETQAIPTFAEALNEQLGLKLEPANAQMETIIIDHIEQPSPN